MSYKILKVYDHIMNDTRLKTLQEKYLVSYVWSWQVQEKTCFVNDAFLTSLLDLNYEDLHKLLTNLQKRCILKVNNQISGSSRTISVIVTEGDEDCSEIDIFSNL